MAVDETVGGTDREHHRQTQGDGEGQVQLAARRLIIMALAFGVVSQHCTREQGRPQVAQVNAGSADFGEADWREVDLANQLAELASIDLVDFEARERLELAVALLRPVIDTVVAERAEVETAERAVLLAG